MPSNSERRLIGYFVTGYNTCNQPQIIDIQADNQQEAPDAICRLGDGRNIGLELTSVGAPKSSPARHSPHLHPDLTPLDRILDRKLSYDYRGERIHEVWLLVHLRLTLPYELVEYHVRDRAVPYRFSKIYLQWPEPGKSERTSMSVLELPSHRLWKPNLPRPNHTPTTHLAS